MVEDRLELFARDLELVFVVSIKVDEVSHIFVQFLLQLLLTVHVCFTGVLVDNAFFPEVYFDFQLLRHFLVDFDYGVEKGAVGEVGVHQLCLDSRLELVLLRLETLNLIRGQDDAQVVNDHTLTLDGNIAFAILLERELVIPLLVQFHVEVRELRRQLFITIME